MQCVKAGLPALTALLAFCSLANAAASVAVRNVEVEGTAFRVTLSDRRIVAQEQLPGTILLLAFGNGAQRRVRVHVFRSCNSSIGAASLPRWLAL
jgi:hypothetical protein